MPREILTYSDTILTIKLKFKLIYRTKFTFYILLNIIIYNNEISLCIMKVEFLIHFLIFPSLFPTITQ